ncbi:SURF1 family protein [Neoroseomonas alba]|uniref:SURF1 family protein n=1 Tax=Roseomonas alba TaxID=2846776 RepID=UPI0034E2D56B
MTSRHAPALAGAGALVLVASFVGLGLWQLQRRAWKHALIAQVEARVHAAPAPVPGRAEWPQISAVRDGYRRVLVEGRMLRDRETLVRATTVLGSGYWVITPMQTADGTILVNRGFVPPERRDASTRGGEGGNGPVRIVGLLRLSEPGGGFLRANDPAQDRWYSRDVAAIAARRGIADAAPFFVDAEVATGPENQPVGGLTVIRFVDNHLIYALTWFGLALLSAWAGLTVLRRGRAEDATNPE